MVRVLLLSYQTVYHYHYTATGSDLLAKSAGINCFSFTYYYRYNTSTGTETPKRVTKQMHTARQKSGILCFNHERMTPDDGL